MRDFLPRLAARLNAPRDRRHRTIIHAHLFDDTLRMLEALAPSIELDAIIGVPYSSNRTDVAARWQARFGDKVHIAPSLAEMERIIADQLARSLALCRAQGQRLIVQEVGGFVTPLLHSRFRDELPLVKGVVELTKQGLWRAQELDLAIPVLHCADSELKRLEARRCGETIARCLDGLARELGLSLAGRAATVFGAGWIGMAVAQALKRLDAVPALIDLDPLKAAEARLEGFTAATDPGQLDPWLARSHLVVGATGRTAITREVLERLRDEAIVASGSSRQLEIDMAYLRGRPAARVSESVEAVALPDGERRVLLVNDGFPVNFIPGSQSVPDEIVEMILGELMILLCDLAGSEPPPGLHRITPAQEAICAELWLALRDGAA